MNKVNRETIKQLIETEDGVSTSMYMPTHRFPTSEHISEDRIRFKNLIKAGKEALTNEGVQDELIARIVNNLKESVYDDSSFWQQTTEGTAVFCTPADVQYFNLPAECDEYVSVGDSYDVAPLLALESCNKSYYLLALATKHPLLFVGDMYGLEKVDIDLPKSMIEALNIDELHSNSQTVRSGGYGAGAKAHGQGDSRQAGQEEKLKFFRLIDEKLLSSKSLDKKMPLLLAGTEDEVGSFKDSSRNKNLLESYVSGNYTEMPAHEIHAESWPLVAKELCEPEVKREIERVHELLGTGLASLEDKEIYTAASEGRVENLLVGLFSNTRDSVGDGDEEVRKLNLSDEYISTNTGGIIRTVFDHGGKVIGTDADKMPREAKLAATYRY